MPPVQAGVPVPLDSAYNTRLAFFGPSTTNAVTWLFRNTTPGARATVTQIDVTATNAGPVQCFFQAAVYANGGTVGPSFYYDSQSIGEGLGIWFSWRGALVLAQQDAVALIASGVAPATWGAVVGGFYGP